MGEKQKFKMQADVVFEADDIEDAVEKLIEYFDDLGLMLAGAEEIDSIFLQGKVNIYPVNCDHAPKPEDRKAGDNVVPIFGDNDGA